MPALKRKQSWPLGIDKGNNNWMQTKSGHIQMVGHVVGDYFYTPDIGRDKWEIWNLSDVIPVKNGVAAPKSNLNVRKTMNSSKRGISFSQGMSFQIIEPNGGVVIQGVGSFTVQN